MPRYEVDGVGGKRIVTAPTESEARDKAMRMRWGEQTDHLGIGPPYRGEGLYVKKISGGKVADE